MFKPSAIRQLFDFVVMLAMGVAAVMMIWRGNASPSPTAAASSPSKLAIEDVSSSGLTTTLEGIPTRGDTNARIVVIEFADFECPFCRKYYQETFGKIDQEFVASGQVRYGFRHFPLEKVHFSAMAAARAAECAAAQDKFWEMRSELFERQPEIGRAFWVPGAKEMGLQPAPFAGCLKANTDDRIRRDQEEANRLGVKVTPTLLLGLSGRNTVRVLRRIEGAQAINVLARAITGLSRGSEQ